MAKFVVAIALIALVAAVTADSDLWLDNCDTSKVDQQFVMKDDHTVRSVNNDNECFNLDNGFADVHGHVFLYGNCGSQYNEKWTLGKDGLFSYDSKDSMCIGLQQQAKFSWVWLVDCTKAPHWSFDAKTGLITNTETKLCLSRGSPAVKECDAIDTYPWCNYKLGIEERLDLLAKAIPVEDKITQLITDAPALPQYGIPKYNWWSEAAHGICADAPVSSFPTSPALAATRNLDLMRMVGSAISDEGRAIHNQGRVGLTFFAPNINIVRDPRWGRTMETYGEDPFLNGKFVTEFVRGMQEGDDSEYMKVASTPKHYAAYSLEHWNNIDRTGYDAKVSDVDLLETYLPAFEAAVRDGKAASIMCSYNAVNGVPSCANKRLLQDFLRDRWGFQGYVVSDCDAVANVYDPHHFTKTPAEAAAVSLKAGTDLDCTSFYRQHLPEALQKGLVTEADIDTSFRRLFWHRIKLGMFDPKEKVSYNSYGDDMIASTKNKNIALNAAKESLVLLKNDKNVLPLDPTKVKSIAAIGPNADDADVILGNYNGHPDRKDISTFRDGLAKYTKVNYAQGAKVDAVDESMIKSAVNAAQASDVVVLFVGLSGAVEAEGHDRVEPNMGKDLRLTGSQEALVKAVQAVGKPTVLALVNGGAVTTEGLGDNINAIIECFYGGQAAGDAFAQVLFGDANPSGRLPYTIYPQKWLSGTSFGDMDMHAGNGRTWKYTNQALYPFGFGLSYTTFEYKDAKVNHDSLTLSSSTDDLSFDFSVTITNTGDHSGAEVIQLVAELPADKKADYMPRGKYVGFTKVYIPKGETRTVTITVHAKDLATAVKSSKQPSGDVAVRTILDGSYKISAKGAGLADAGTVNVTVAHSQGADGQLEETRFIRDLVDHLRSVV